jgi:hypothetical protein
VAGNPTLKIRRPDIKQGKKAAHIVDALENNDSSTVLRSQIRRAVIRLGYTLQCPPSGARPPPIKTKKTVRERDIYGSGIKSTGSAV